MWVLLRAISFPPQIYIELNTTAQEQIHTVHDQSTERFWF